MGQPQQGIADVTSFSGSSIQLFGTISPETGNFSVAIDGNAYPEQLNATWYEKRTNSPCKFRTTLPPMSISSQRAIAMFALQNPGESLPGSHAAVFFASGLDEGEHTLTLVNEGAGDNKQAFEFDYAVVNASRASLEAADGSGSGVGSGGVAEGSLPSGATGDKPSQPSNTNAASFSGASGSSNAQIGPIVGGVVGGLGLLAAAALGWFSWRRKQKKESDRLRSRREAARLSSNTSEYTGSEVKPFPHGRTSRSASATASGGAVAYGVYGHRGGQGGYDGQHHDYRDPHGEYAPDGRLDHGYPGSRTMDSRSEYSQSTDHPGFAFLTDPHAPPVPGQPSTRGLGGRSNAHRPSSPGAMSAYTGYESAGPAPSSQARGSMMLLPPATAGGASSSMSGAAQGGMGSGTTWLNEKDALRKHLYDPSNDGTATSTTHTTLPNPYAGSDGRGPPSNTSPAGGPGDTARQPSMLSPRPYTVTSTSEGVETMSDEQVREAQDSLGRLMTHSRNGSDTSVSTARSPTARGPARHVSGPSVSTVRSPDSAYADVPPDAPPGYSESVASGERRSRSKSGKSRRGNEV